MDNSAKETVIIVHGTWAEPKTDLFRWYQISDERQDKPHFVSKLNRALEERSSAARCWAHCKDNTEIFSWSGENDQVDRTRASLKLAAYINNLQFDGWRCHVVAHSHGGNIVAEALPQLIQTTGQPTGISGTITTLGTPFIDAMSPIDKKVSQQRIGRTELAWHWYLVFAASALVLAGRFVLGFDSNQINGWSAIFMVIVALLAAAREFLNPPQKQIGWTEYWRTLEKETAVRPFILSISSGMDEAWQLLRHVQDIQNPIAPNTRFSCFMLKARLSYINRIRDIFIYRGAAMFKEQKLSVKLAAILAWLAAIFPVSILAVQWYAADLNLLLFIVYLIGLTFVYLFIISTFLTFFLGESFYSVAASPIRWLAIQLRATRRILNDITVYVIRRRGWSLLQEIAFGLQGYSFDLPKAEREPPFACPRIYKYEDLSKDVEQRALSKRDEWLRRNFGAAAETFSRLVVTASDLSSLLRIVETDLSLVHAAYYTDDECIEHIADWIARNN